ncbi:MAG: hypothetical protein WAM77_15785, partial [Xanthobacteraceae bacterium]
QYAERRITKNQQGRRVKFDSGLSGELGLSDFVEEHDSLVGDILFDPCNRFIHSIGTSETDDTVDLIGNRRVRK